MSSTKSSPKTQAVSGVTSGSVGASEGISQNARPRSSGKSSPRVSAASDSTGAVSGVDRNPRKLSGRNGTAAAAVPADARAADSPSEKGTSCSQSSMPAALLRKKSAGTTYVSVVAANPSSPSSPPGTCETVRCEVMGAASGQPTAAVPKPGSPLARADGSVGIITKNAQQRGGSTPARPPSSGLPAASTKPTARKEVTSVAAAAPGGVPDGLKPVVKRSSSSSTISGLVAEARVSRDTNGSADGATTVRATVTTPPTDGSGERRTLSGRAAAAPGVVCRGPRVSSGSVKETPSSPSLLLPFRSPSGSQHPASLTGQSRPNHQHEQQQQQEKHPNIHQYQHSPRSPKSPQSSHYQQQQEPQTQHSSQQQQNSHGANRAVRFSQKDAERSGQGSGSGSPPASVTAHVPASGPHPPPVLHRRVSDGSHNCAYSPVGGSRKDIVGSLTAPPPPLPLGLQLYQRPSDDVVAGGAGAGGARRERPAHPYSGEPSSPTRSTPVLALPPAAPPSTAPARPVPGSSNRNLPQTASDGASRRSSSTGQYGTRMPPLPVSGGGIRRAVELAPLSVPWELDGGLRDALARAAVVNAADLARGSSPAEPDFGYARVVEQHRRQKQRKEQHPPSPKQEQQTRHIQEQHQQQQQRQEHRKQQQDHIQGMLHQQQQQRRQDHQNQNQQQATNDKPKPSPKRTSLRLPSEVESEATSAPVAAASSPAPKDGADKVQSSGAASGSAAPSPDSHRSVGGQPTLPKGAANRPPLPGKKEHRVLKPTSNGAAKEGDVAEPHPESSAAPHPPAVARTPGNYSALASASYRFLGLRRPSSKSSVTDSDRDSYGSHGTGNGGAWIGAGASVVTSVPADTQETDPLGFLMAENVEIRIHCLTFNMGGIVPLTAALPESLFSGSYLSPDVAADAAHIYVFATQESGPLADWEAAVGAHLGRQYTRVAAESLMSIHILLFAVRSMVPYIADVQTSSVATGVGNVLGNKGGVAVTFTLLGARVLLVGAHFAAHDQNVERRNADFHRICAGLFAPPSNDGGGGGGVGGPPTSLPRSSTVTPERPRGVVGIEGTVSGRLALDSSPCSSSQGNGGGGGDGSGQALAHSTSTTRRGPPVPAPSRFARSGAGVTFGSVEAAATAAGPPAAAPAAAAITAEDAGDETDVTHGTAQRNLTRALSTSSVCSMASNASAYPSSGTSEAALRSRTPSFWDRVSFSAAHRHSTALLSHFDVVLWMGDLNYRIAGTPGVVKFAIDENMMEVLWANDQLQKQQKKGKVLQGFHEMPIAFAPTFKFTRGTDNYDLRRAPSWTDRVLYLVNADPLFADLRPLYYMSVPELRTSDHKPVIAGFELSISPLHAADNHHARQRGCIIS